VTEVDTTGTFDWLGMTTTDRRRSLRFPRFSGMSSCMGSGELGGSGTVVSLDGGGGSCSKIIVEYVLGLAQGHQLYQ
jgi:hypothetical protein